MKTVFIPTDFSPAAHNASIYAINFAKAFNAKVILYHVYEAVYLPVESMILAPSNEFKDSCEEALAKEAKKLDPDGSLDIKILVEETFVFHKAIIESAKKENASVIFLGMKKDKGLRKIFGSTCCTLSINTKVPVIVVPEDAAYKEPKTITMASDLDENTDSITVEPLKRIGQKFNSKLFITRVITKQSDEVVERLLRPCKIKYYLASLSPEYNFIYHDNVAKGMNKSVERTKADMMAVIPHHHDFLEKVFVKSNTEEMIFNTYVPLLILPEQSYELQKKAREALVEVY
jgi:nucleotide-binding universal stress UspA family protein